MPKTTIVQKIILVLFGLLLCIVLLEAGLRIAGFTITFFREEKNRLALKTKGTYRIMCLGESTTVWGDENSWPSQLEKILNQEELGLHFTVINKGRHAVQSAIILSMLERNLDECNPDMVITMIGINDGDNTVFYDDSLSVKSKLFFTGFRVYKLAGLLYSHIVNKIKEISLAVKKNEELCPKDDNKSKLLTKKRQYRGNINKQREIEIELRQELKKNPKNVEVLINLGRIYYNQYRWYDEAEELFKKSIEINPMNYEAYNELGFCYSGQGRYKEAENMFKKAIGINPSNDQAYAYLGYDYREQGRYQEAEEMHKRAIAINPRNGWAYSQLGRCYSDQKNYEAAEGILKKAIAMNLTNCEIYIELGLCYREQDKIEKYGKMLKKAVEVDPDYYWAYIELGWFYGNHLKNYNLTEEIFNKAIAMNPTSGIAYIELANYYKLQDKSKELEELAEKAKKLNVLNDRLYGYLAVYYQQKGDYEKFKEFSSKADKIRLNFYPAATRHNYQRIKDVVTERGIKLVCVQYPMRNVEPLKKLFDSTQGMVFVDNEKVFKSALTDARYEDYFDDNFAGDFGHCSPKGNMLLAKNIADTILKEYFGR